MSLDDEYKLPNQPPGDRPLRAETVLRMRRDAFYWALDKVAPQVVDHLLLIGDDAIKDTSYGALVGAPDETLHLVEPLASVLNNWSKRWQLDEEWIRADAAELLVDWWIDPSGRTQSKPRLRSIAGLHTDVVPHQSITISGFHYAVNMESFPREDVKKWVMEALEEMVDKQLAAIEQELGEPVKSISLFSDAEILVEYQVLWRSGKKIAMRRGISRTAVRNSRDKAAAGIGLTLRERDKGGKP